MSRTNEAAGAGWTRILATGHEAWVGTVQGELFLGTEVSAQRRVDRERPVGLLPLLEKPRSEIVNEISERESELGAEAGTLLALVPLDAIPAEAVESRLDFWVQLALDWLDETPTSGGRDDLLAIVECAPWASQRARHRASRLRTTARD